MTKTVDNKLIAELESIRWMTSKQAATYTGYRSSSAFRRIAAKHQVPRHGPKRNRYDRLELDQWMRDPAIFIDGGLEANHSGRKAAAAFTPIHDIMSEKAVLTGDDADQEQDKALKTSLAEIRELRKKDAVI